MLLFAEILGAVLFANLVLLVALWFGSRDAMKKTNARIS